MLSFGPRRFSRAVDKIHRVVVTRLSVDATSPGKSTRLAATMDSRLLLDRLDRRGEIGPPPFRADQRSSHRRPTAIGTSIDRDRGFHFRHREPPFASPSVPEGGGVGFLFVFFFFCLGVWFFFVFFVFCFFFFCVFFSPPTPPPPPPPPPPPATLPGVCWGVGVIGGVFVSVLWFWCVLVVCGVFWPPNPPPPPLPTPPPPLFWWVCLLCCCLFCFCCWWCLFGVCGCGGGWFWVCVLYVGGVFGGFCFFVCVGWCFLCFGLCFLVWFVFCVFVSFFLFGVDWCFVLCLFVYWWLFFVWVGVLVFFGCLVCVGVVFGGVFFFILVLWGGGGCVGCGGKNPKSKVRGKYRARKLVAALLGFNAGAGIDDVDHHGGIEPGFTPITTALRRLPLPTIAVADKKLLASFMVCAAPASRRLKKHFSDHSSACFSSSTRLRGPDTINRQARALLGAADAAETGHSILPMFAFCQPGRESSPPAPSRRGDID